MISHHNGIERVPARDELARRERDDNQRPATAVYAEPVNAEMAEQLRLLLQEKRSAIAEIVQQRQRDWDQWQGELEQLVKEAKEAEAAWRAVCGRLKDTKHE